MYLISLNIQQTRSRREPDKPGKVYVKVIERTPGMDGSVQMLFRTVSTDIPVPAGVGIKDLRAEVLPFVYNTYLIIEKFRKSGAEFTIDDVCERLREVIGSNEFKTGVSEDFVWDSEVATLKKELIPFFRYNKRFRRFKICEEADTETESLSGLLHAMSLKMLSEGRESSSNSYMSTRLSLNRFLNDKNLPLADIDRNIIEGYAGWLKDTGVADSTRSFYLRTLRTAINYAVKEGIIDAASDLFRNVNTKARFDRADNEAAHLSRESILKIANLDLSDSPKLDLARDMFMFGFYCRGMEQTDIINLRPENLRDNELTYRRRGTGKEITLSLDPEAAAILKKYDNRRPDFLFPLKTTSQVNLDKPLKYQVSTWLDAVGKMAGVESLTFGMNISTWNYLVSQASISSVLLGT